ncbi:MAG: T9SS type A sorting domain-containing protein [Bacteroidia bacterium]
MKQKLLFFVTFISICVAYKSSAQLWTTDNVNVTLTAGAQLTVKGDVQNQNGATITNNGTIDLSGNWTHNAANNCFGTSAGLVIMNGANQNIGGTGSTAFNNLTLIGSGIKTLLQDISVGGAYVAPAGVLSLGDRNLDLNSHTLTLSNAAPAAVTRTTGFAISETQPIPGYGYIRWNIGTTAAGNNYTFPFGNLATATYLPLSFNLTTAGAGNGYVRIATYPTNTAPNPNNRPLPTGLTALINNSGFDNSNKVVDRYFIFDVQGYTTTPVSTMVFPYRDTEWSSGSNLITEANLKMQRLNNGVQWTQPPFGVVNTVSNTVTVTAQNNYSPIWTIVDLSSPLPVSLLNFNAQPNEHKQTDVYWQTASEINCADFEVQKSKDSKSFETFDVVESHHFSNATNNYQTIDKRPYEGITYYRLKQNDLNGDYVYSKTVSVRLSNEGNFTINVYPNPMTDEATIQIISSTALSDNCIVSITNVLGQIVMENKLSSLAISGNSYSMKRGNIAPGIYYLNLVDNKNQLATFKLVIQ